MIEPLSATNAWRAELSGPGSEDDILGAFGRFK